MSGFRQLSGSSVSRTTVLVVGVLAIELAFVFSYVGGLGRPYPHEVPFGVVGPSAAQHLVVEKIHAAGTQFSPVTYPTEAAAVQAIRRHRIDGAIVIGTGTHDRLIVAGAPSPAVGQIIVTAVGHLEAQAGRTFTLVSIVPLSHNDPEGLAPFYVVVGWVVGGYLVASLIALARGVEPTFGWVLVRLAALAAFAVASGVLGALLVGPVMHLVPGNVAALAGFGTLVVFAVSTLTTAFQVVFGEIGIALAIVVFVVIGNPSAGGPYPRELLNGVWRVVGAYVPNGAGLDAVRNIGYFGSADLGPPAAVLVAYSVVGVGVVLLGSYLRDRRRRRGAPGTAEAPGASPARAEEDGGPVPVH